MNRITYALLLVLLAGCRETPKQPLAETRVPSITEKAGLGADGSFLLRHSLLSLLQKSPEEIGCLFQTEFNYRDSVFNCDSKYDSTNDSRGLGKPGRYDGFALPEELAKKIHPAIEVIDFEFEGGSLRDLTIMFKDSLRKDKVKELFQLPGDRKGYPENVWDINYGDNVYSRRKTTNPAYTISVTISGFEHRCSTDYE